MKAPSTKLQHPENFQAPNINKAASQFGAWSLVLLWSLEVGAWSFSRFIIAPE
jgi:hypothetical protein